MPAMEATEEAAPLSLGLLLFTRPHLDFGPA